MKSLLDTELEIILPNNLVGFFSIPLKFSNENHLSGRISISMEEHLTSISTRGIHVKRRRWIHQQKTFDLMPIRTERAFISFRGNEGGITRLLVMLSL